MKNTGIILCSILLCFLLIFCGCSSPASDSTSSSITESFTEDPQQAPSSAPDAESPVPDEPAAAEPTPEETQEPAGNEDADELFCGVIPVSQVDKIQNLGHYVSAMIEFPNFSIYHSFTSDDLVPEHMLMAIWKQEKLAKGSGTSAVGVGEVEERIRNMFGIEAFFGDYPSGPVGMELPISYESGDFIFDLTNDYGTECILSYAEPDGSGYFCELDISSEGRLVPCYKMNILPYDNEWGYIITSMETVN